MDSLIKSVETRLKQWTRSLSRDESRKIAWALSRIPRDSLVMEVGCGFGGKLEMLRKLGFRQVMGVEKNPESAAQAASRGFTVLTVAEYDQSLTDWKIAAVELLANLRSRAVAIRP